MKGVFVRQGMPLLPLMSQTMLSASGITNYHSGLWLSILAHHLQLDSLL